MEPANQNNSNDFIETLLTSFEDRIQKIESVFSTSESVTESSHALMNDFQHSLQELREERTQLNTMLRENMAKNGSLRKNDYDILMGDIFILLDEKEKEAEDQFNKYVEDQKAMVRFLRQGILEIKNTEQNDHKEKIEAFKLGLETILKAQQQRKEHAISKFLEFQDIHKKIITNFQQLLDQNVSLLCKDIKKVKKHLLEELV
jgi:hypothetical protein